MATTATTIIISFFFCISLSISSLNHFLRQIFGNFLFLSSVFIKKKKNQEEKKKKRKNEEAKRKEALVICMPLLCSCSLLQHKSKFVSTYVLSTLTLTLSPALFVCFSCSLSSRSHFRVLYFRCRNRNRQVQDNPQFHNTRVIFVFVFVVVVVFVLWVYVLYLCLCVCARAHSFVQVCCFLFRRLIVIVVFVSSSSPLKKSEMNEFSLSLMTFLRTKQIISFLYLI